MSFPHHFLLSITLLIAATSMAQSVNSKAYDLTLSTLLSHSVEETTVKEASQKKEVVFIDSRTKEEYQVSHIKNAIWLGYEHPQWENLEGIDKDQKLIVYCSVGYRSEKIAEQLKKRGFEQVENLYGGLFEWVNQSQPIVDPRGNTTQKVHAYNRIWGIWLNKGEKIY